MNKLVRSNWLWPILLLGLITFLFSWKFFLKGLVPIPSDIIVGIYYPWRDHIWNNFIAGVPFKNGLISDVVSIIYPWRIYGMELIKNGQLPLWIPQALCGTPLLANFQSGVLYPLNLLFFIFSNVNAWSLYIILQPFLASVFCYFFLKNLHLDNLSSLLGGIIFAFSGFMMVWYEYGIVGHAGLWLPLILLSIDKIYENKSRLFFLIGSLAVLMSILAGYPQVTFYSLLASSFFIIFRKREPSSYGKFATSFFLIFLGIILSSIQIISGLELWINSIRQTDPTVMSFNYGIIPIKNLITFIIPDFFGNSSTLNFWGWANYNETACYIGILGLILVFLAFITKHDKDVDTPKFFKLLFLISLLFVFENPIAQIPHLLNIPGLGKAVSGRGLFLVDFSLSVLAAYGLEAFLNNKNKIKVIISTFFPLFLILFTWIFVLFFAKDHFQGSISLDNFNVAKRNMIFPSLLIIVSFIIFIANSISNVKYKFVYKWLIFLLVIFDLFRFGWKYNPYTEKAYLFPETKVTDYLINNSQVDRFVGLLPQSMWIPYNIFSVDGYEPLMIKRYSEFSNNLSSGSRWVRMNNFDSPLLNLSGTKYLLSYKGDATTGWDPEYFKYPQTRYELIFQYGKTQIYENKESLPRAFLAPNFIVLKDDKKIMETLLDKDFDPRKTVVLEEQPSIIKDRGTQGIDEATIDSNTYLKNIINIKTKSMSSRFLVVSDNYYPGWKAFVDGQETKIYRANYTFRAIVVPGGEHEVKFIYNPESFKIGSYISGGTLLILIIGIILVKGKKK